MLNENIKMLRKQKGYSQEQLADKLNVVRQTISKWEKGYSVPDADMLEDIADIFEVSVSDLLGKEILPEEESTDIGELLKQLTILNEYLAEKVRRRKRAKKIFKRVCAVICITGILSCIYLGIGSLLSHGQEIFRADTSITLTCILDDKDYYVKIDAWKDNNEIHSIAHPKDIPATVREILESKELFDKPPEEVVKAIETYFTEKGGTCEIEHEILTPVDKIIELIKIETNL